MRALVLSVGLWVAAPAWATWSVVAVDQVTGEVGLASATCVANVDLVELTPVMVVARGGATAQSRVDSGGVNRNVVFDGLLTGAAPSEILARLEDVDFAHQSRQYGIADVAANPEVTFTGTQAGGWAGGVIGQVGDLRYAIQGNVLTGAPVVEEAERAFVDTAADLPTRMMAAMRAAYLMGGDGRCSCSYGAPEACGSPPPDFEKSAHVGYLLVSRFGDVDGGCDAADGCATGSYYMRLDVANKGFFDRDPVLELYDLFLAHRQAWKDRPDHYASTVAFTREPPRPQQGPVTAGTLTLRDWRGTALAGGGANVTVTLAPGSTVNPVIGKVVDNGDGTYTFRVGNPGRPGTARFRVDVDDGAGPVTLAPPPTLVF